MFFERKPTEENHAMFDQQRIGANIMKARKAKGYTQMTLADALGVSFQAVSNWERGQTCPDIANLSELSRVLDISIDELLGNKRAAEITKEIAEDKTPVLEPEELVQIAPLLSEEQADRAAENRSMTLDELAEFAPFVSRAFLNEDARTYLEHGCRLKELTAIAPFLDRELLRELAFLSYEQGNTLQEITPLAPFLGKEVTSILAQKAYDTTGILSDLSPIAPFIERELLSRLALDAHKKNGLWDILSLAPFIKKETLNQIAADMLQTGKLTDITPLLPFLDKHIIEGYLNNRR